jgi:hypothetical protein
MIFRKLYQPLIFVLLIAVLNCAKEQADIDAASSASETYVVDPYMILPPRSESYKVIGVVDGLKEFVVQYDKNLFRGGEPYSNNAVTELKKMGVTSIICITPSEVGRFRSNLYGFNLVEIPFASTTGPSPIVLNKFFQAVANQDEIFYLHAHGGAHRAGIIAMAYRIYRQHWETQDAIAEFELLGGSVLESGVMIQNVLAYKNNQGDL